MWAWPRSLHRCIDGDWLDLTLPCYFFPVSSSVSLLFYSVTCVVFACFLFFSVFQLSSSLSTLPLCVCALPVVYVCHFLQFFPVVFSLSSSTLYYLSPTFSISLHLLPLRLFRVCASVDRARKPPATCPLPPLLQFAFPTSLPFLAFFHYYTVPPPSEREATAVTLSSSHHPTVQFIVAYSHISTHSLIVRWCKSWYAIRQLSWFICQGGRVWLPSSHPRGSSLPSSLQY